MPLCYPDTVATDRIARARGDPGVEGVAWLEQAGLLDAAATAAEAGSSVARLAFRHAAKWHRDSPLIAALAAGLGLDSAAINAAFGAADAIRG